MALETLFLNRKDKGVIVTAVREKKGEAMVQNQELLELIKYLIEYDKEVMKCLEEFKKLMMKRSVNLSTDHQELHYIT